MTDALLDIISHSYSWGWCPSSLPPCDYISHTLRDTANSADKTDTFLLTLNVIKISLFPTGIRTVCPSSTPGKHKHVQPTSELALHAFSRLRDPITKMWRTTEEFQTDEFPDVIRLIQITTGINLDPAHGSSASPLSPDPESGILGEKVLYEPHSSYQDQFHCNVV